MSVVSKDAARIEAQDAGPKPRSQPKVRELDLLPEDAERLQHFRDAPAWEIGYWTMMCYGRCPVYEIMLDQVGNFYYDGRGNVALGGKHELTTNADDVRALYDKLLDLGFLRLREKYENEADGCIVWSDGPTQVMRLTIPEDNKPLRYYNGCEIGGPAHEALRAIKDAIDTFPPVQRLTAQGGRRCGEDREHTIAQQLGAFDGDGTLSYVLRATEGDSKDKSVGVLEFTKFSDPKDLRKRVALTIRDCQGKQLTRTTQLDDHTCGLRIFAEDDMKLLWPGVDIKIHAALFGIEDVERESDEVDYDVRLLNIDRELLMRAHKGERCEK
jgi:hypothetical protein